MDTAGNSGNESNATQSNDYKKQVEQVGHGLELPTLFSICRLRVEHLETSKGVSSELFGIDLCANTTMRIGDGWSLADAIVERCLRTMRVGETCLLQFTLSGECVQLRMTLEAFDGPSPAPFWEMNAEQLLVEAMRLKTKGVELYRSKPHWASRLFVEAVKILIALHSTSNKDGDILLSQCYTNLAACHLLVANHEYAIVNCDKALALDASNVKCRFRRATAAVALQNYEQAADDLKEILRQEPANAAAVQLMETLKSKTRAYEKSLGKALSKMFS